MRFHQSQAAALGQPLQTVFAICAAYGTRTDATLGIVQRLLANTESVSLARHLPWASFADRLAGLQALILYHIMMLFGVDTHLQLLAEQQDTLLAHWTGEPETACSTTEPWVLCESARRAVVISYLLRGVYYVQKYKTCCAIGALVGLPVSVSDPNSGWLADQPGPLPDRDPGRLTSYHGFVKDWEDGRLSNVDDYGQLLIVACKGLRPVRQSYGLQPA